MTNFYKILNLKKILNSLKNREKIRNELECLKVLLLNNSEINIQKQEIYLYIFKIKEKILLYIKGCKSFIDQFQVQKTEFYDDLIGIENELNLDNIIDDLDIIINDINKLDNNLIDNFEKSSYINFILIMFENKNFLSFIIPKTEEDIKKVEEIAGDIDDEIITDEDIKKLIDF